MFDTGSIKSVIRFKLYSSHNNDERSYPLCLRVVKEILVEQIRVAEFDCVVVFVCMFIIDSL